MSKKAVVLYTLVLFILFAAGSYWHVWDLVKKRAEEPFAKDTKCQYHNINPLRCEPDTAKKKKEYVVLRSELVNYIDRKQQEGKVKEVAIYFRDLQNGPILNINEQENFIPASLLKLPFMIMYFKKAESDPAMLAQKVTIKGDVSTWEQNVTPGKSAKLGESYTIEELLTLMITESDNVSWKALLNYLRIKYSEDDFIETLSDLGIVDPRKRDDQQYITVQGYASLFRILFNSSYLNIQMSDKALCILKETSFNDGIVAGIPNTIQIAHKFGEQKNGNEQQFHDCGVVYYPNNPYVICIMTRGASQNDLKTVIKEISQKVYNEVHYRNTN